MIKVSIVVPIYNVSEYLRECLDSIVNQTLKDIEIICVNDGSTDNSLEIIKEYSKKDSRIIIIDKPNSGYGHSMNVGIDRATGKYIGIVEPDDYVKLDMYETLYNEAEKNDVNIVKSDFYRFTGSNDKINLKYHSITNNKKQYYNKILSPSNDIEVFNFYMMNWTGIYKTEFIKLNKIRHNETPGASFQDNGFWFQNFTLTDTIYFIDKAFYYNRRDNPNSSVHNKEKVFCIKHEFDFIKNFLENNIELKNKYIYIYQYRKFHSYLFSYRRIANE
ncbi:glycosyltransferase, partial [Brachyspira pulli]|uniref:glycosyltransferase family 2 protein n=1 Tax=Brachyspira pulli TaxID=310721 RepID=UPI0030053D7A